MSELQFSVCLMILSVSIASAAQILLKLSANRQWPNSLREYLNPFVIGGYGLMLVSTVLTMLALRHVPLSWSPLIESLSYIFVSVLGYFILKERFSRRKLIGLALILVGVMIIGL